MVYTGRLKISACIWRHSALAEFRRVLFRSPRTPAPVPTLTPNPAYKNLKPGDRGAEVRRLQEKLAELGYLPEDGVDGAYGGQTRKAVRLFQYYNSLQVDGIAGDSTQTNLFENPLIVPAPTAESTEAPTDTPEPPEEATEAPTEELTEPPTDTPTEKPTEAPTEVSTEAPTETPEPTEEATEEPSEEPSETPTEAPTDTPEPAEESTEEPTEAPTEKPTEAPTEVPTEAPTETPEPTEEATEEPTETPTETPTEAPTEVPTEAPTETPEPVEVVEDILLDEDTYEDLAGWIVLNDSGSAMQWIAMEDGVTVIHSPRIQINEQGILRVSLGDVVQCVEDWTLTHDGSTVVLEAAGYVVALYDEAAGLSASVDGIEISTGPGDFDINDEDVLVTARFLATALHGDWEWDGEESTLMFRIPGKALNEATD